MGTIRVLLALAVAIGHFPTWGGGNVAQFGVFSPLPGYFDVQAFFIISGFYMELISRKYAPAGIWTFYSNRYLRLIPSYLVVLGFVLALTQLLPDCGSAFAHYPPSSVLSETPLAFSVTTMFGLDLVQLFGQHYTDGMPIPQAWSIGLELWFYLLVPFLTKLPTRWLIAVTALSFSVRLGLNATMPFFPWQQRLFPAELMFFVMGMLAYRWQASVKFSPRTGEALAIAVVCVVSFGSMGRMDVTPFYRWETSVVLAALFFISIPAIFQLTRESAVDSFIGELSYPIYLTHIAVGYFVTATQHRMWLYLTIILLVSAALAYGLESPLETWRKRRLERALKTTAFRPGLTLKT